MKNRFALALFCFFAIACEDHAIYVEEFPDWVKLSIPHGQQAFAIAGDIEKTLLVTTQTKAYYTTDLGQSWIESKDFQGPVKALLQRGDTVVAMFGELQYENEVTTASTGYLYTLDFGKSWHYDESGSYLKRVVPIGIAVSDWGVKYRITPEIMPGIDSLHVAPSQIEKWPHENNQWGPLALPLKVKANNIYLDAKGRLYVAAYSGVYQEQRGIAKCDSKSPAWVFISKRPLPQ